MSGATRHADDQWHVRFAAEHVPDLGRVVHDLVVGDQRKVDGHQLDDRSQAEHRGSNRCTDKALFRDGRVDDALGPELVEEAVGDAVRAAEGADVLADEVDVLIALHLLSERLTQGDAVQLFVRWSGHARGHQSGSPRSSGRFSHSLAYTYL